ncbi:hypothetical protein HNY73_019530 [Argiope bruennichi]|uniref:Uncharacterized protein n=1 Tax=Argiope bruennichi TaxID=94029 RepID=A0A8T0E7L9_ARGBR|nr:hypothetical protein HNY73_019530 [Argiope bruennichi]
MENGISGESSYSDFDESRNVEEEEVNDAAETELSLSPTEPERLFVEAVRKLSSYEHSLETLVKRFNGDETQIDSEIRQSETAENLDNSSALADNVPGRTDVSAGGDHTIGQTLDDRQMYVKIRIPYQAAEIVLRILDEDLDKVHRSALKQAESCLENAKQNLITLKTMLQIQLENSNRSQEAIIKKANEIADDMFKIIDKLREKLIECQVQNLSELLVRAMKDEAKLTMLERGPEERNGEETANTGMLESEITLESKRFYAIIFCCVAGYFMVRLMMLYLERDVNALEKIYVFIWQPFREEVKQLFVHLGETFYSLIRNPFYLFNKCFFT